MPTFYSAYKSFTNRFKLFNCERKDFRTNRHIVVFESDDWGSIRMSNKNDWEKLLRMGYAVDKRPYERFDTLESPEDLEALFEVLCKYKDCNGNHPVITANMLMANPDFRRIEESGFQNYYYEPISNTYTRYFGNLKVLDLIKQGLDEGLFMPQSHGREHFNIAQWMRGLRLGDEDLMTAFRFGMCGIAPKAHPEKGNMLMNALWAEITEEMEEVNRAVADGLRMFEQLFGYKSRTFVAPCYLWNEQIECVLAEYGVQLIQTASMSKQLDSYQRRFFYSGQRNNLGLVYSIRNCKFEPSTSEGGECVGTLMREIDRIFAMRKLAVISTHRINYVSGIDEMNRRRTLKGLNEFLQLLLRKYPDVEFISSDELIRIMETVVNN